MMIKKMKNNSWLVSATTLSLVPPLWTLCGNSLVSVHGLLIQKSAKGNGTGHNGSSGDGWDPPSAAASTSSSNYAGRGQEVDVEHAVEGQHGLPDGGNGGTFPVNHPGDATAAAAGGGEALISVDGGDRQSASFHGNSVGQGTMQGASGSSSNTGGNAGCSTGRRARGQLGGGQVQERDNARTPSPRRRALPDNHFGLRTPPPPRGGGPPDSPPPLQTRGQVREGLEELYHC
ncbi:unnamed protein product [Amoebophrya sp. A25]|nr:unnamed protein product [Amoebophrya sp. A25]|eukprot:GSA25T00009866001.1